MEFVYHPVDHVAFSGFGDLARQLRTLLNGGGPKGPPSAPPAIPPIIITPFSYQTPGPAIDPRVPPDGPPLRPPRCPDWRLSSMVLQ